MGRSSETQVPRSGRWARIAVGVLPATVMLGLGLVFARGTWQLPGVDRLIPFADLAQVTYNADCTLPEAGTAGSTACDPLGRPYNYPPVWAGVARAIGLGGSDTWVVGTVLAVLACAVLAVVCAVLCPDRPWARVGVLAAVVSPPMLLMIGRGNTDLVIVVLLGLGVLLQTAGPRGAVAGIAIGLASGLKLYPVGSLLAVRGRWQVGAAVVSAAAAIGWLALPYLSDIRSGTPAYNEVSFGAGVVPSLVRGDVSGVPGILVTSRDQAVGVGVVVVGVLGVLASRRLREWCADTTDAVAQHERVRWTFLAGAGAFLATYVLTTSFDYRLYLLVFVAVAALRARRPGHGGPTVIAVWAVLTAWSSYPLPRTLEVAGDVAMVGFVVCLAAVVLVLVARSLPWPRRAPVPVPGPAEHGR